MRYSIVKIVLFLFSSSFFAINQNPPEVQNAIAAISQAILQNRVLIVNGPDEMPGINDIKNGDVVSFKKILHVGKTATQYINKYLPENRSLLWSKMKSFSINSECPNLCKILTRRNSNNTANKNPNWKIWLYEGNDNVYYYFETIKQNTEKKPCKKTSTAKKPPRKRQKISSIEEKSEIDLLTEKSNTETILPDASQIFDNMKTKTEAQSEGVNCMTVYKIITTFAPSDLATNLPLDTLLSCLEASQYAKK